LLVPHQGAFHKHAVEQGNTHTLYLYFRAQGFGKPFGGFGYQDILGPFRPDEKGCGDQESQDGKENNAGYFQDSFQERPI
jgi:hypothetical protein